MNLVEALGLGMRMTPEQYFTVHGEPSPTLFYEAPREVKPPKSSAYVLGQAIGVPMQVAEFPSQNNHVAIVIGVVAIVAVAVAVVGIVLGLAYLAKKS